MCVNGGYFSAMPRYRMTIAYEGTNFHGWQKQHPPGLEPLRTAQGVLEEAVRAVMREPVDLLGASRTDAGVHARGQIAAFTASLDLACPRLLAAINARLPGDLQVRELEHAADDFNPISDCTSKGYRYTLVHGCRESTRRPLFDRRVMATSMYELDVAKMNTAAKHLLGEHDFAAFTRLNHGKESTVRRIDACAVTETKPWHIAIDVSGGGFLWNMVRIVAGTLVEVGRGSIPPDDIPKFIASCDRRSTGPTMPPEGLCLEWVRYE
jgi:tRNA pseudouridine38-40 synthase